MIVDVHTHFFRPALEVEFPELHVVLAHLGHPWEGETIAVIAGVVLACGVEVRTLTPGIRVAVHPVVPCGECLECTRGFGHLCVRMGHLEALRPRGRLVIFRALPEAVALDLVPLHLREQEIVGACNDEERLDDALRCLSDPELGLPELVTHELPFARWAEAFALARDGHDRALKVALTFPETQ